MVTWHISNDARRRCEAELETSEIWSSGTSSSGNMYLKHLGDMTHLKWCKKKCCLLSLKHLTPEVLEPHHVKDMAAQLKQDQVERYGCWTKVDQVKEAQSTHFFKPMPMRFQANAGSFPTMQELPNQSNLGIWDFFQIVCICIYIYICIQTGMDLYYIGWNLQHSLVSQRTFASAFRLGLFCPLQVPNHFLEIWKLFQCRFDCS